MGKGFLDKYFVPDAEKPFDAKAGRMKQKKKRRMGELLVERYVDALKPKSNLVAYREEIERFQKKAERIVEIKKIPPDRMHLGFKSDLDGYGNFLYVRPYAPRINPLVSKDGALTHNGMVALWIATRGGGKSIAVSVFAQDGIVDRYRKKVPMITIDDNPTQEWDVHEKPITILPQLAKQKEAVIEHFKRWNDRKPRGYTSITYGFGFAGGKERIDRPFTLTLRDFFAGMEYNPTQYKRLFMDLIGLDEGAIASRSELSRALTKAKEQNFENISALKKFIIEEMKEAKGEKENPEAEERVKGQVTIPYINNALDDGILSDSKEASLRYLFDDIDDYDNVILRINVQVAKSGSYQDRIGVYSIFFLDKIIQERIVGTSSDSAVRKACRLSIDKYPAGPIFIIEEAKYIIPNNANSYTKEYMEDQVNLGRKNGGVFCFITQFADLIDDKIAESADYTFISKVNTAGTNSFLISKGIDRDRIETELRTLEMKKKGPFGLELSEYRMIDINNNFSDPFIFNLPESAFKIAGT